MGKRIWLLALGMLFTTIALAQNKPLTLDVDGQIGIDHGESIALGNPMRLKQAVEGKAL